MEYEVTKRLQQLNGSQQAGSHGDCAPKNSQRTLQDQVISALPPIGKKQSIASDFGVGPPPLLDY